MAECGSSSKPTDFHIRGALQSDIDFLVKCMLDAERGPFQRCYWDIAFGNAASSCTAEMFKIPNNGTLFSCECWLVAESFGLHHKRYALLYKIIEQKKLLGAICFHPEGTKTDFVFPPMIEAAKRDCNLSEAELTERLAKANTIDRVLAKIPQGTDTLVVEFTSVIKEARCLGVATALLNAAAWLGHAAGCTQVQGFAYMGNTLSLRHHLHLGGEIVATITDSVFEEAYGVAGLWVLQCTVRRLIGENPEEHPDPHLWPLDTREALRLAYHAKRKGADEAPRTAQVEESVAPQ